jgi:cell division protein FtsB
VINFQNKRRIRQTLGSPAFTIVLLLILVFLFESGFSIFEKKQDTSTRHDLVASEMRNMESERAFLETEIQYMATERGKEEEVRKKFGVAEEGELMAVIVESDEGEEEGVSVSEKRSLWSRFIGIFK